MRSTRSAFLSPAYSFDLPKVSADGTGVYVGGERGGLMYLTRDIEDGSLALSNTWAASDFDEAIEVKIPTITIKYLARLRSNRVLFLQTNSSKFPSSAEYGCSVG